MSQKSQKSEVDIQARAGVDETVYFRDGKRKIDAILVYEVRPGTDPSIEARTNFFASLKAQSLEIEEEQSLFKPSRRYVKIHAPLKVLHKYGKMYGFPMKYEQITKLPEPKVPYEFLKTILNDPQPDPNDPVAQRAWKTISKQQPTEPTTCERHEIVFEILQYTRYGQSPFEVGLSQLVLKGVFLTAYPLHDGPWEWPPKDHCDPLNDRQLLAEYWANFRMWYKQQPLNIVERYFGPEVGMYFSWLGFYNKMLIIASALGVVTFLYGLINVYFVVSVPIDEACKSELIICPFCKRCQPKVLKSFCTYFKLAHLTDNLASVIFACAMSFWATSFMEFWKRKQATQILRWNLETTMDDVYRPEFQATATDMRPHEYTGEMELFIPLKTKLIQYSLSVTIVIFMIVTVLSTILAIIILEVGMKMSGVEKGYITLVSSFITLFVMMGLRKLYGLIAMQLTNAENPRTQFEFDKSYMIKMIVFSIVNSYGKLMYIAFFKGKFFTYPGDPEMRSHRFPLTAEICDPTGCVTEVFVLLSIITIFKPVISNTIEVLTPIVQLWLHKMHKGEKVVNQSLQTWEQDFDLNAVTHYRILGEVEEMVMQYGFVTLLVAAFPLAPLLALINNIFEIRIDSTKLVKYFRRSKSVKSTSMNVWFDTLQAVTYMAVITNALFITFTSNFIPSMVYYFKYKKNFSGYFVDFCLSKYKVEDKYWYNTNITECYYSGYRHPPESERAYQHTYLYYYILSWRLGFAIIFVIVILGLSAVIAYAIPDVPAGIRDLVSFNARKLRQQEAER